MHAPHVRLLAIAVLLDLAAVAQAQRPPDIPLNAQINREVVNNTITALNKYYVSEEVAARLEADLRTRLERGEYDSITSAFDLIDALDEHLRGTSQDRHLAMLYSHVASPFSEVGENITPETPDDRAESLEAARCSNFGFEKVARLPGNIGLLEFNSFVRPEFSGEMAGNAMSFLAGTEALIIDLRASRGGSPDMVTFVASYFFPGDECYHLCDWRTRVEGVAQQCWTYPYLPGQRYLDRDVYILTAGRTFSAPEGLAALLQHTGRRRSSVSRHAAARIRSSLCAFTPTSPSMCRSA
jgi:hypothetical protein